MNLKMGQHLFLSDYDELRTLSRSLVRPFQTIHSFQPNPLPQDLVPQVVVAGIVAVVVAGIAPLPDFGLLLPFFVVAFAFALFAFAAACCIVLSHGQLKEYPKDHQPAYRL